MLSEQKNGDWRGLWQEMGPKLLLFARQQTPLAGDADDIVQEAFVRFWKSHGENPKLSPTLLFTLVKRTAIDHGRKRACRQLYEAEAVALSAREEAFFEPPMEDQEKKACLESSLRALPDNQREVLVLKIWGELTFEQIGETLAISPHTAASRYRYALNQLKGQLNPTLP